AVERRLDRGVGQVVLGQPNRGGGVLPPGMRLGQLGGQDGKLLLGRLFLRGGGGQRGGRLATGGNGQLIGLPRGPAAGGEAGGAGGVGARPGQLGLRLKDRGLGGLDGGLLLHE